MHVLILGAAGMVGRKLAAALALPALRGDLAVSRLTLTDVVEPATPKHAGITVETRVGDVAQPDIAARLLSSRPDCVVHLAAIVSGEAEADFDKGYRTNLDGTRVLFEAIRRESEAQPYKPKVIFASSIAVFGAPFPAKIGDDFLAAPLTSYGTQKAICELLLSDYTRRGFFDGIGLRLPTLCVRPGKPNKAASGFFSNILREPLIGAEAVLPVADDVRHWFASPRAAVGFLLHAMTMNLNDLGSRRNVSMPGLSATVGEEIAALRAVAGDKAVRLIKREPNEAIALMVAGWPQEFDTKRALALGFRAERSMDEILRVHIEDELGGSLV